MSRKPTPSHNGSKSNDQRFANFQSDPRFRLPSKHKTKTKIDKRFRQALKDPDFIATAKVDRYGRKLESDTKRKALERLYEDEEQDVEQLDDDTHVQEELARADTKYDPARGGGFSSESESESESDEDEDEDEEDAEVATTGDMQVFRNEQVETGEVTNRLALVNMDWDRIKSVDLMALLSSFVPANGRIEKISIYPSEFGKERMQREEMRGPPKEIWKSRPSENNESVDDSEDEDERLKEGLIEEGDDQDYNSDALRKYQLDRLRYWYAVIVCSSNKAAEAIYEATDGREYQTSSNFLDLRFIPDDMTFDDEPRDECDTVPTGYQPIDFVTDALQHSRVKLTWDMHPEEESRKESISRAFSVIRKETTDNDDLRAYLASDSEEEEEEEDQVKEDAQEPQLSKKELARQKMRAALGLNDDPAPKRPQGGPVGEMQITFASALSEKPGKTADPSAEETTIEKYLRKEKEKRAARKQTAKAKREGVDPDVEEAPQEDLGFDDPFFTSEEPGKASKAQLRKEERRKKREARVAEAEEKATERAQLELLMADDTNAEETHLDHFDMNEITLAEKKKNKKKKRKAAKEKEVRGGLQEDFEMDVKDPRFSALFDNHEFAIDPSNPRFKATPGMQQLLEEGRKKRKGVTEDVNAVSQHGKGAKKAKTSHGELSSLVDAIKRKAKKSRV